MKKWIVLAVVVALAVTQAAMASEWQKLGAKTIWDNATSEVVKVKGAPTVSQLQFKVSGKPIRVQTVKVFFADGGSQDLAVNQSIQPGFVGEPVALDGAKAIEHLEIGLMLLDTQSRRGATITVLGS